MVCHIIIYAAFLVLVTQCWSVAAETVILLPSTSASNPLTLDCSTNLSGGNNLIWKYTNTTGDSSTLSVTTTTLNLTSITEAGEYICKRSPNASVMHFSAAYLAEPVIQNTRKSITFNDGDKNRKLTCVCEGSYPPVTFGWRRRNEDGNAVPKILQPTDSYVNITTTTESSTLLYVNLTFDVQAYYECVVTNGAGNKTDEVLVRVKDRLAALWPFLGIVAEVVVLIIIIFMFEKRSKKSSASVSDEGVKDDAELPLKNDDDGGTELRNRAPNNNYK